MSLEEIQKTVSCPTGWSEIRTPSALVFEAKTGATVGIEEDEDAFLVTVATDRVVDADEVNRVNGAISMCQAKLDQIKKTYA